jgi:hypothetical protein
VKKLLVAVTLTILVGSPALAQSYDPGIGTGNLNAAPYRSDQTMQSGAPYHARAQLWQFEPPKRVNAPRGKLGGGR